MIKRYSLFLVFCIISFSQAQNSGLSGSYGYFHTHEARVFAPGKLTFYTNTNFYTKLGEFLGSARPGFEATNYWLTAANLGFSYGLFDNVDATLSLRVYQDTHYENEFNLPDDIFFTLKRV